MAMALPFTLSEELLVAVLSQLEARDLRHVAVAHPKFGLLQCCAVAMPAPRVTRVSVVECELDMPPPPCGCGCMRPTSTHVRWTLVQAAAWLQIQGYSTAEQAWLPRMPLPSQRFDLSSRISQSGHPRCWLWALAELEALKRPFQFSQVHEQARVATSPANPAVHVVEKVEPPSGAGLYNDSEWASAIGSIVMRAGQHYCEFTWVRGDGVMLGIVTDSRAAKQRIDAAMKASGELWLTPCSYFFSGAEGERVHWGDDFSWAGRRGAQIGDRIGLLLDCDRMTLAVYINDTRLGVMLPWHLQAGPMEPAWRLRAQRTTRAGMDGPWCAMGVRWAVEVFNDSSVRAEIKPAPVVTATELKEEERLAHEWLIAQSEGSAPISPDEDSSDEEGGQENGQEDDDDEGGQANGHNEEP